MYKEIITFGDTEIEKRQFHSSNILMWTMLMLVK